MRKIGDWLPVSVPVKSEEEVSFMVEDFKKENIPCEFRPYDGTRTVLWRKVMDDDMEVCIGCGRRFWANNDGRKYCSTKCFDKYGKNK